MNYNGTTQLITITSGNYNGNTLITELQARFTQYSFAITVTLTRSSGILNFSSTVPFTFYLTGSTSMQILGFNALIASTGNAITLPFPMNLVGVKRLRIGSSNLTCTTFDSNTGSTLPFLCSIPVDVQSWGMISYLNTTKYELLLKENFINQVNITITDEYGNLVNFHNTNWTICLQLNIYRNKTRNGLTFEDALGNVAKEIHQLDADIRTSNIPIEAPQVDDENLGDLDLLSYNN